MFAPEVVEAKLDRFAEEFGWRPKPHTLPEVDAWSKRLEEVFVVEKNGDIMQRRPLTKA